MKGAPIPLNPAWKRYDEDYCLLVDEATGALLLSDDGGVNTFKLYAESQVDVEYLGPDVDNLNFENFPDAEDWPRKVAIEFTGGGHLTIGGNNYIFNAGNQTLTPMPSIIQS